MNVACYLSASRVADEYHKAAYELGLALGQEGHALVFGGYVDGMMGSIANGFADAEAKLIGVVPGIFGHDRRKHRLLSEIHYVETLAKRKETMMAIADVFIALPGGVGTLDELFEVITLKSIDRLNAPVIIYNVNGFYDPLLTQLQSMQKQGFIRGHLDNQICVANSKEEIIQLLNMSSEE